MKILLTGSTGFLGQNLAPVLERQGHELWHLVRSPKGFAHEIRWDFSSKLPAEIPSVDGVIHLAAKVCLGQDLDQEQYAVNVISTGYLAQYASQNGSWLIFSSTAVIHGDEPSIGKMTVLKPLNHYAMTKILAEDLIRMWCDNYRILRIGGIYGLDGPAHLGLNRSISEAFYHKTAPVLKGSGQALRNYIAVNDLARWIAELVGECQSVGSRGTRVIYCAGPETMAIKDYLRSISLILTGSHSYHMQEGLEGKDFVIEGDIPPFTLTKFEDYLKFLLKERKVS